MVHGAALVDRCAVADEGVIQSLLIISTRFRIMIHRVDGQRLRHAVDGAALLYRRTAVKATAGNERIHGIAVCDVDRAAFGAGSVGKGAIRDRVVSSRASERAAVAVAIRNSDAVAVFKRAVIHIHIALVARIITIIHPHVKSAAVFCFRRAVAEYASCYADRFRATLHGTASVRAAIFKGAVRNRRFGFYVDIDIRHKMECSAALCVF